MATSRTQPLPTQTYPTPMQLFTVGVLLFIVISRCALAPRYLYYFDSANFALALDKFDPALHQPQPPGYPLFVALTRLLHLLIPEPQDVLLVAGLVGAVAATLFIRVLASDLFGRAAGILAMAVLASNPVFWFGGITNQIRVFLALTSVSLAMLAWRALNRPESGWLYATFAALGLAAGFRPEAASLLAPVCFWALLRKGWTLRQRALALACLLACALPWAVITLRVMGGPVRALAVYRDYSIDQFHATSALYGASAPAAVQMFLNALVWNLDGALVWIWAVPFAARAIDWRRDRRKIVFLCAAYLPCFLFSGLIHIGDPDQALASVAILCAVGGGALAGMFQIDRKPHFWRSIALISLGMIAAHTLLFFFPPNRIARAASFKAAVAVDNMTSDAIDTVEQLRAGAPLTIVHYGSPVASRQLMYYFPHDYVVVLPGSPDHPRPDGQPQVFFEHKLVSSPPGRGLLLGSSSRILCLTPRTEGPPAPGAWFQYGVIYYQSHFTADSIRIGPYVLTK